MQKYGFAYSYSSRLTRLQISSNRAWFFLYASVSAMNLQNLSLGISGMNLVSPKLL